MSNTSQSANVYVLLNSLSMSKMNLGKNVSHCVINVIRRVCDLQVIFRSFNFNTKLTPKFRIFVVVELVACGQP